MLLLLSRVLIGSIHP
jgi:HTH-type transcriptional regulator/antitoxin HipB